MNGGGGLAPLYQWRVGFLFPPLRSYYCSQYYIQVADCTVEFSYVYMLYVILYYIVYVNQPRARNW